MNRVRSEYSEMENGMAKMRITLQSSSSNSTKDRRRVQELSEEVKGDLNIHVYQRTLIMVEMSIFCKVL